MPNHPTAPVFESVVGPVPTNCDSLKLKYGIVTRKHCRGSSNARKESHHILQDKAMTGLISKYSGWAVLLNAGSGGEHERRQRGPGGAQLPRRRPDDLRRADPGVDQGS